MKGPFPSILPFSTVVLLAVVLQTVAFAAPSTVEATISIPETNDLNLVANQSKELVIEGSFVVTDTGLGDTLGGLTATLMVSGDEWNPILSDSRWTNVEVNKEYRFNLTVTIDRGARAGETNTYTLTLTFSNPRGNVGTATKGVTVSISSRIDNGGDDDDDDVIAPIDDKSFPLWPFFIAAIVIGLIVVGIWAKKNLEVVHEEDGSKRIMIREKDSGHILGRKKQPPPELDL